MQKMRRLVLIVAFSLGCVGCDQASKVVARTHLSERPEITFFHDTVRLVYAENSGAFLSVGASLSAPVRTAIFQIGVSILTLCLFVSAAFWPHLTKAQVVALTLLGASGLGNLIDRVLYDGYVTDFLNLGIGTLRTGIFNVADVYGVVGAMLLIASGGALDSPDPPFERSR